MDGGCEQLGVLCAREFFNPSPCPVLSKCIPSWSTTAEISWSVQILDLNLQKAVCIREYNRHLRQPRWTQKPNVDDYLLMPRDRLPSQPPASESGYQGR